MSDRIESTILRNLLADEAYFRKVIPFLESDYFHDPSEKIVFDTLYEYAEKYKSVPTPEALSIEIDNQAGVGTEEALLVVKNVAPEENYVSPGDEWLLNHTEKFCKDKAVYNAVMASIQILDGRDEKHTKEAIPELLKDSLGISFDSNVGHDYIEDAEARFEFYHKKDAHLPFDLEFFDKITKGGLVNKTLNVLMAGPGVGKTLAMTHFTSTYLMQGKNVLYITMEMAEERISERVDANLLNVSLDDLVGLTKARYDKKIEDMRAKTTGKLIVKEFPTATAGVGHFRHLINELSLKKNFRPDVVVIDYINICSSSRFKMGTNVNSYTYIKSIAEELRGFAVELNVPVITATQVNRSGFGNSDMGLEDTAESFGLPATADLFLALITSEELERLGQIMVKQLKNRYGDPTTNRKFIVGVDRPKMRLFDVDQGAVLDTENNENDGGFDNTSFGKRLDFNDLNV